jgi:hypothetical protein
MLDRRYLETVPFPFRKKSIIFSSVLHERREPLL